MNIAEASTAMHQMQLQSEVGFRVASMAQDTAKLQAEGVARLIEGASTQLQVGDANHLGNLVDIQA